MQRGAGCLPAGRDELDREKDNTNQVCAAEPFGVIGRAEAIEGSAAGKAANLELRS